MAADPSGASSMQKGHGGKNGPARLRTLIRKAGSSVAARSRNWLATSRAGIRPPPVPASALQETVARYNSFVDLGADTDFGKPAPKDKI